MSDDMPIGINTKSMWYFTHQRFNTRESNRVMRLDMIYLYPPNHLFYLYFMAPAYRGITHNIYFHISPMDSQDKSTSNVRLYSLLVITSRSKLSRFAIKWKQHDELYTMSLWCLLYITVCYSTIYLVPQPREQILAQSIISAITYLFLASKNI